MTVELVKSKSEQTGEQNESSDINHIISVNRSTRDPLDNHHQLFISICLFGLQKGVLSPQRLPNIALQIDWTRSLKWAISSDPMFNTLTNPQPQCTFNFALQLG